MYRNDIVVASIVSVDRYEATCVPPSDTDDEAGDLMPLIYSASSASIPYSDPSVITLSGPGTAS